MTTQNDFSELGGGSLGDTLLFFDCSQNSVGVINYYNQDALEFVSGSLRPTYNDGSDITFTSKVDGTLTIDLLNSSQQSLYINGTNVIQSASKSHTTATISKGDTIRWVAPRYWSIAVCYLE